MDNVEHRGQFTQLQWDTLQYVELGMTLTQACKKAGYKEPIPRAMDLRNNKVFREEMNVRLNRNKVVMKMTRDRVQSMVLEAFDVAKLTDDANAMVRAASEINKMCGFYEAEQAEIDMNKQKGAFLSRLNALSDEELLAMSNEVEGIDPVAEIGLESEHLEDIIDAEFEDEQE